MAKDEFLRRYEEWGFPQNLTATNELPQTLRVNERLISLKKFVQRMEEKKVQLEKVYFLSSGYHYTGSFPVSSSIEYLSGYFYIQEAPAQLIGEIAKSILAGKNYDECRILDMCAAPGGKTTHLAEILRNKGSVLAVEVNEKRAKSLCYNCERLRTENVTILQADILEINPASIKQTGKEFDVVVLDAPCSGNFGQEENWFEKRSLADVKNRQKLQRQFLDRADELTAPGKHVIYSTCSLEIEENEQNVEYMLKKGYVLEPIEIDAGAEGLTDETKLAKRFWPTQHWLPAFFVARLRKL